MPAPDVDSYQRLEKRSHRQVWGGSNGGSEGPRQGFDGFGELLTTCAAVNLLLVVEKHGAAERAELTERIHGAIDAYRSGSRREARVNRWRCACTL